MSIRSVRTRLLTLLVVLGVLAAACSSSSSSEDADDTTTTAAVESSTTPDSESTTPTGSEDGPPADSTAQAALDAVNAELEGLDADARRARLIEMAMEEGGEVSFYTSQSVDDILPTLEAFEDATDMDVALYRAGGNTVVNRIIQEAGAGYAGADVFLADQVFVVGLEQGGQLLRLDTPIREDILDFVNVSDKWLGSWINAYIVIWNTDLVSPEQAPKTWEDVYSKFPGDIGVDPTDSDLFMTLVDEYFIPELGMTEEETVEFFKKGLQGGYSIRGHTVGNALNMAGEFAVHGSQNITRIVDNEEDGAPYGWLPAIQPIVARGSATGIVSTTENPASALLLIEFLLTDGQVLMAENGLSPANETYDVPGALQDDWWVIPLDAQKYAAESDKWDALWEEILIDAGTSSG